MAKVTIDKDGCKGCGLCVTACPQNIVKLSKKELNAKGYSPAEITDMEKCTGCCACAKICPDFVFIIER